MDRNIKIDKILNFPAVALRKESVDRNNLHCVEEVSGDTSLSARRAWIEILNSIKRLLMSVVTLRKESVDRNSLLMKSSWSLIRRSPQGERG